jgi:hypothetical protein
VPGGTADRRLSALLHSADLWLNKRAVKGFDRKDFPDLKKSDLDKLENEIDAFLKIAATVPPNKPSTKEKSKAARKHLESVIHIVAHYILADWIKAQQDMINQAKATAQNEGWHVFDEHKKVAESLLGEYEAPRLRIKTQDTEVVFDPVAYFGAGRQGIVEMAVMPSFETRAMLTFKNGQWRIMPRTGNTKPLTQATLVNTITSLSD